MTRSLFFVVVLLAAAPCLRSQDLPTPALPPSASRPGAEYVDYVAAKVNRAVITKSQVDREIGTALPRLSPAEYEREFRLRLLRLVFSAIEQDAVERVGLVVPKRYVLEQVELQKEKKGAAEVLQGIREQGYKSEEEYVEALEKDISRQTYVAAQAGQYGSKASQFRPDFWTEPTALEIRQYYRQHVSDEFQQRNQAHLYAIFLPYAEFAPGRNNPSEGIPRTREIAAQIKDDLARGVDFETLARRYSRGLKAEDGGNLGWIEADSAYQKEILDFALKGPVKELSSPMLYPTRESPRGIAVFYVSERVDQRVMPFTEAQTKIRDALRAQRVDAARKKIVGKMLEDAYVSPPDLKRELLRSQQQ
jgi:hypothetical protein